jgi:glycerol kinase
VLVPVILALDQGTTSSRAILFDDQGRILGKAQEEHPQIFPEPGWVEHGPQAIWGTQRTTARRALAEAGVSAHEVAAIGIANQRETTLLWERSSGRPLGNAIVWQDRRTAPLCDALRVDGVEEFVRKKTGLLLDPYFSATKLRWMLDNIPQARDLAERGALAFGTVDTFLLWKMTGGKVHATDVSNASRTLLFNIHTLDWDDELLTLFGVSRSVLPEVLPSSHIYGETRPDFLGAPIPIGGVGGDQQAATFGQACFAPGMVKNTYGTGSFLLMNTGDSPVASRHRLLTTVGWQLDDGRKTTGDGRRVTGDGQTSNADPFGMTAGGVTVGGSTLNTQHSTLAYALEGSIFVTGAAIQWLRDELGIIRHASESEALARAASDNGGVYFVPAFAGLGAPYWDPSAQAAITGLTRGAGKAHIARAALEAACFQSRDVLEAMQADTGCVIPDLRVDGGMTANDFLLQLQADLLGIPVHRPAVTETTALGAAYLAGVAAGVWKGTKEIAREWRIDRTFEPEISSDRREALYAEWKNAVARVLKSIS